MNNYKLLVSGEDNFIRAKNSNKNFFFDKRGSIINITTDIKYEQSFISKNKKNVLRGIHLSPYDKYVTLLCKLNQYGI